MMKNPMAPAPSVATVSPAVNVRSLNDDASACRSRRSRSSKSGTRWICSTDAGTGRDSTRLAVVVRRSGRCGLGPPGQLLDLPLGDVELRDAETVELLAALPQCDCLVELGLATLEPLDDL